MVVLRDPMDDVVLFDESTQISVLFFFGRPVMLLLYWIWSESG